MLSIIADLHTHTLASGHGIDTARTMAESACRQGLDGIGITDHGPGIQGGPDPIYFLSLKRMFGGLHLPIRIFTGVEDDISSKKGELTLHDDVLSGLDLVIAGLHPFSWIAELNRTERTEAIVNAMGRGKIRMFTHPVGTYYDVDIDPVIDAAVQSRVALELNTSKLQQKKAVLEYLEKCARKGAQIAVNSDAHLAEEVGQFSTALDYLHEVQFPEKLIINRNREAIASFFGIRW